MLHSGVVIVRSYVFSWGGNKIDTNPRSAAANKKLDLLNPTADIKERKDDLEIRQR
jgi:hypothetical protein